MPYFYYAYGNTSWLILLLGVMLLGFIAQSRVKSTYNKYSQVLSASRTNAADMARELLQGAGSSVSVAEIRGSLTDHYDPRTGQVGLSSSVYPSSSVGALAVAAHEVGHVMQYEEGYVPIRIRNAILPVANFGSQAAPFIVIVGAVLGSFDLAMVGVYLFCAMLAFQLITLPVEFNASRRGIQLLTEGGYINESERPGAQKVLRAASMTYVVAVLSSLVSLVRLLLIANNSRRR